jgi:uncharacterized membrane protein YfcA
MLPVEVAFTLLLPHVELYWLSLVLALTVVGCGLYLALRRDGVPASERALLWSALPTGALAGTLGGLFGMGGPVVFLLLSRASPDPGAFRRRTLVITTAAGLTRFITLTAIGALTPLHYSWLGWAAPVILVALLAGVWAHKRIKPRPFRIGLGVLVTLAGLGALLRFAL